MPTEPIKVILPKTIEPEDYQPLLNSISSTLEEIVNYGTQVVHWVGTNPKYKKPDVDVTLVLLSRHILEIADSISILIKQSSIDPCKILLRSALETMIYIKFITAERGEERSKAYLVCYMKNKKNEYLRYRTGTILNKQFKKEIVNDMFIADGLNPFSDNLDTLLDEKLINLDRWTEYNRVRKKNNNQKPPWYLLYGGAKNIEKLSDLLKYKFLYEVVYRKWSDSVHASDVITGRISRTNEEKASFYQIRLGTEIIEVTIFAIDILLTSYRALIEFIVPEMISNYNQWYIKEIKLPFDKIRKTKIKLE